MRGDGETKRIMKRRMALLGKLFTVDRSSTVVKYIVRPGMEAEAAQSWQEHGVCPECSMRTISCGHCAQCGWESTKEARYAHRTSTMADKTNIKPPPHKPTTKLPPVGVGKDAEWLFNQITGASSYGFHFRGVLMEDPHARSAAYKLVECLKAAGVRGMD